MGEILDGEYQKYVVSDGKFVRENFFGKYPELLELVKDIPDAQLARLKRGGHDPVKVYAAYKAAVEHKGSPTVILVATVKGYGLGEFGEGLNAVHQIKVFKEKKKVLAGFRDRFNLPLSDDEVANARLYQPAADSAELKYLQDRRKALGGYLPQRRVKCEAVETPGQDFIDAYAKGSGTQTPSTTMVFVNIIDRLLKDRKGLGKFIVPIIPDEARTFGMDKFFTQLQDLFERRPELHPGGRQHGLPLPRGAKRPDPRRGHHRGRLHVVVHRRRDGLRDTRSAHDPVLHLLLDVWLPAHRRSGMGRRRSAVLAAS